MANRLAGESSPYLVAHSGNPVDWFPWGREALEKAEKEDKPIFLSIGYSACHWCHVMERESFQNRETAEILNSNFICIKVDREERPDLDSVYMAAVQVITGRGGWPLNAFLLPDGTPFYGGTYFPPLNKVEQYGIQSFPEILLRIADAYRTRRHEIESSAEGVIAALRHQARVTPGANPPGEDFHGASIDVLAGMFDHRNGGFQGAPKFPMATILEYLLRFQGRGAAEMALVTLRKMACGGIRDHLGGGFHRYSTDRLWLIPHFEKMLYDNALLGRVYTEAFQITGEELFRRTAETTLDFILREMRVTEGGFCSSMDADSPASSGEMEEGAYYTWTREEIREVIGPQTEEFCSTYGVAPMGALRGRSVLHLEGQGLQADMQEPRAKLLARRAKRGKPFRDNKVITAWNGMAIRALASASHILGRSDYLKAAVSAADFIIENMVDPGGILFRSWKDGRVSTPGFLQDYALLASGFLEIHRATGDHRFFDWANRIVRTMIESFRNPNTGHMGSTGNNNELLFAELFDPMDSAVPSGMSAAAEVLLKLWAVTGEEPMYEEARKILSDHSWKAVKFPVGFGRMLCASLFQLADTGKAMIEGSKRHEFIGVLNRVFSPFTLLAPGDTGSKGKTRVVICGKGYCLPPVFDQASFEELLKKRGPAKAGPQ